MYHIPTTIPINPCPTYTHDKLIKGQSDQMNKHTNIKTNKGAFQKFHVALISLLSQNLRSF